MSRIGRMPIPVPPGVKADLDGQMITITGPKGSLTLQVASPIEVKQEGGDLLVTRPDDERDSRALHGLTRTLISNMIEGVTKGYERRLVVIGLGYKAELDKKDKRIVLLKVGYANTVGVRAPEGVTVEIGETAYKVEGSGEEKVACITVRGADKQVVGQYAADLRAVQPAEPYQGKGVRYFGENVRRKEGKTKGA